MDKLTGYVVVVAISLAIFMISSQSQETSSWWVNKLKQMASSIKNTSPLKLGLGFIFLIFTELAIILYVAKVAPWAIKGLYIFASFNTTLVVITLWLEKYFKKYGSFWIFAQLLVSALAAISWIIFPDWVALNIVGAIGGVAFLSLFPQLSFVHILSLGIAMITYDVVGVYATGWIVQLVSNIGFTPPAVIIIPTSINVDAPRLMMIGLGDIITGGIMLGAARLYKAERPAFLAYCLAIATAYIVAITTNQGVPATMYIIPFMVCIIGAATQENPPLS